jgi:hypothetical protein
MPLERGLGNGYTFIGAIPLEQKVSHIAGAAVTGPSIAFEPSEVCGFRRLFLCRVIFTCLAAPRNGFAVGPGAEHRPERRALDRAAMASLLHTVGMTGGAVGHLALLRASSHALLGFIVFCFL